MQNVESSYYQYQTNQNKNEEWYKKNIDNLIGKTNSNYDSESFRISDSTYYRTPHFRDYKDVLNLSSDNPKDLEYFKSLMHVMDITKPVFDHIIGLLSNTTINANVVVLNPDVVTIKDKKRSEVIMQNLRSMFYTYLKEKGVDIEAEGFYSPEELVYNFESNYRDKRASVGQNILEFLTNKLDVKEKLLLDKESSFSHYLRYGKCATMRLYLDDHSIIYRKLNPLYLNYSLYEESMFIEDGEWATYEERLSLSEIVDTFGRNLTLQQVKDIEKEINNYSGTGETLNNPLNTRTITLSDIDMDALDEQVVKYTESYFNKIPVYYCFWKTLRKIGFVTFIDENYQIVTVEVDSDFNLSKKDNPNILDIKWIYKNEACQGVRIGTKNYILYGPCKAQIRDRNNYSLCKLPINGIDIQFKNSLMSVASEYQKLYNVYTFKLLEELNGAKGKILKLNLNKRPSAYSATEWLNLIIKKGILLEEEKEGEETAYPQEGVKAMDVTNYNAISLYIEKLNFIEEKWRNSTIARQALGIISSADGKATTEKAIQQNSYLISSIINLYKNYISKELQYLLELGKQYIVNNNIEYIPVADDSQMVLMLDENINIQELEYGIVIRNDIQDEENIATIKYMVLQDPNVPLDVRIELIEARTIADVKNIIKKYQVLQQLNAQNQMQQQQAQMEEMKQYQQQQDQMKLMLEQLKKEADLNKELIRQETALFATKMRTDVEREKNLSDKT